MTTPTDTAAQYVETGLGNGTAYYTRVDVAPPDSIDEETPTEGETE